MCVELKLAPIYKLSEATKKAQSGNKQGGSIGGALQVRLGVGCNIILARFVCIKLDACRSSLLAIICGCCCFLLCVQLFVSSITSIERQI